MRSGSVLKQDLAYCTTATAFSRVPTTMLRVFSLPTKETLNTCLEALPLQILKSMEETGNGLPPQAMESSCFQQTDRKFWQNTPKKTARSFPTISWIWSLTR